MTESLHITIVVVLFTVIVPIPLLDIFLLFSTTTYLLIIGLGEFMYMTCYLLELINLFMKGRYWHVENWACFHWTFTFM